MSKNKTGIAEQAQLRERASQSEIEGARFREQAAQIEMSGARVREQAAQQEARLLRESSLFNAGVIAYTLAQNLLNAGRDDPDLRALCEVELLKAITALERVQREFPGRPHWTIAQEGWQEVAGAALEWIEKNAPAAT